MFIVRHNHSLRSFIPAAKRLSLIGGRFIKAEIPGKNLSIQSAPPAEEPRGSLLSRIEQRHGERENGRGRSIPHLRAVPVQVELA